MLDSVEAAIKLIKDTPVVTELDAIRFPVSVLKGILARHEEYVRRTHSWYEARLAEAYERLDRGNKHPYTETITIIRREGR